MKRMTKMQRQRCLLSETSSVLVFVESPLTLFLAVCQVLPFLTELRSVHKEISGRSDFSGRSFSRNSIVNRRKQRILFLLPHPQRRLLFKNPPNQEDCSKPLGSRALAAFPVFNQTQVVHWKPSKLWIRILRSLFHQKYFPGTERSKIVRKDELSFAMEDSDHCGLTKKKAEGRLGLTLLNAQKTIWAKAQGEVKCEGTSLQPQHIYYNYD